MSRVPDGRGTVGAGKCLSVAVGEVDIMAAVIKPVYFTTVMFKEVIYSIVLVVLGDGPGNGLLETGSSQQEQQ